MTDLKPFEELSKAWGMKALMAHPNTDFELGLQMCKSQLDALIQGMKKEARVERRTKLNRRIKTELRFGHNEGYIGDDKLLHSNRRVLADRRSNESEPPAPESVEAKAREWARKHKYIPSATSEAKSYGWSDLEAAWLAGHREGRGEGERLAIDDQNRCAVCGWPLVSRMEDGCIRASCSMRPRPLRLYAPERAKAESEASQALLARTEVK